jgi:uncharacterized protein
MIETMMALGNFRFSINGAAYQTLKRTAEYRWPSQARVGREPALQFTGPGSETVKLNGVIYPQFLGGLNQTKKMREMAGQGDPLLLTDGEGNYWGKWCITRIEEEQNIFTGPGLPRKISFNLDLQAYGDDG